MEETKYQTAFWTENNFVKLGLSFWLREHREFEISCPNYTQKNASTIADELDIIFVDLTTKAFPKLKHLQSIKETRKKIVIAGLVHTGLLHVKLPCVDLVLNSNNLKKHSIKRVLCVLKHGPGADIYLEQLWEEDAQKSRASLVEAIQLTSQLGLSNLQFTINEFEYLSMICQGYNNSEIARKLGRSKRTVEGYQAKMKNKMRCRGFGEVISKATAWGWV